MKKNKKTPIELNKLAAFIVEQTTCEEPEKEQEEQPQKNPAAVALGKLGGKKGGKARAEKLTPEQRKAIARKAAQARWKKQNK